MRALSWKSNQLFNSEEILGWVVSALAFLFPITVLSVNRADSVVFFLLGLIGVYAFLRHGVRGLELDRRALVLMGLFAAWYATIVLCYFAGDQTGDGFKLLGRNLRLLFFIPAFIACWRYLTRPRWLFTGLLFAPFPVLGLAWWQYNPARFWVRAAGFVDVIPFGDLSLALAFMSLSALLLIRGHKKLWLSIFTGTALIAGMAASGLSGTRGGWIALPFFLIVTVIVFAAGSKRRGLWILGICIVSVLAACWIVPNRLIDGRLSDVGQSLVSYRDYLRLTDRGDLTHPGCLNDPVFLRFLTRKIEKQYGRRFGVNVVDDKMALAHAGLLARCQSGMVIRLVNKSKSKTEHVSFGRAATNPLGDQTLQFIIRGFGRIAINGASKGAASFRFASYKRLSVTQNVGKAYRAIPYIFVAPGAAVYFVPVQNQRGEYIYPFATTSLGTRLEMWRAAWHIFLMHPVLGAGTGTFMHQASLLAEAGRTMPSTAEFDHPHNDYMNALASWGLVGLIIWLLVLGYPLIECFKALRESEQMVRAAGYAGSIASIGIPIFGLTETMFTHSIILSWYATFTAILTAVIFRNGQKPSAGN